MIESGIDPKKPHKMIIEVLEEHSNSGKTLFKCKVCGRISQTPDKWCYTIQMQLDGYPNPIESDSK